jgi:hypothetical protein
MDVGKIVPPTVPTQASGRHPSLRAVIIGLAYSIVGIVFGALAGAAATEHACTSWRLAAWVVSGAVYATHIAYEHFRLNSLPRSVALHVATAVAVGAFGLSVAATVHAVAIEQFRPRYLIALVAWPAITAFPAFLVALPLSAVLARLTRR